MPRARREILYVELAVCLASALLGVLFEMGGRALQGMAIFLFGWSAGCAVHLLALAVQNRHRRRKDKR